MKLSACSMLLTTMFCGVVAAPISLWGRACSGTTDFQGAYGFVGAPLFPSASSAAASSSSSISMASPISTLVQGGSKNQPVAAVGTLVSDGGGNLLAPAATGTGFVNVGTYSVNSDCSISATLIDAYNYTNSAATGLVSAAPASISFEGLISASGTQANLVVAGSPSLQLSLFKVPQYQACTDANLAGTFTMAGVGTRTAGSGSSWFSLFGRISADGAGNLMTDTFAGSSPLQDLQITGTYSINPDCSGSATLTSGKNSYGINFVLVDSPGPAVGASAELQFVFSDAGVVGSGTGSQQ